MNSMPKDSIQALLEQARLVGIEIDANGILCQVHNTALLAEWLEESPGATLPNQLSTLLNQLLGSRGIRAVLEAMSQPANSNPLALGTHAGRHARAGSLEKHFAVTLQHRGDTWLLMLQDDSKPHALLQDLLESRANCETALAVLRAPPEGLRLFLGSAMASVHAIRATLRMPARTQETLREKLGRLHNEVTSLATEASTNGLSPVTESCQALADFIAALLSREHVSGDELLPLAPRVDAIATAIGNSSRIEELRYEPAPNVSEAPQQKPRRSAAWHEVSERRWGEFLRRRGEELGTLARLVMTGAQLVTPQHRRHVDELLQPLLKNALDHGIETPEERLSAGKSAAGHISIGFSIGERGALKMTVHDDGRGFDLSRIGKAAVHSGLLSEESLQRREAGDLVGLIFKPHFTTEGLADGIGQGRGMSYLRRKITHLGGHISVATKAGRYTLFTVELPEAAVLEEGPSQSQALPIQ